MAVLLFLLPAALAQNLPEGPRVFLDTAYVPPTGISYPVSTAAALQTALNLAQAGDEIVLQSGVTFTGNFILPAKTGTAFITLRSSDRCSLPKEGVRTNPSLSGAMAKLQSNNLNGTLQTAYGAHHYRLMGLEMALSPLNLGVYSLLVLDTDGDASSMPHDIIVDRCYIHGNALGSARRGIQLGGFRNAVVDSWISGFKSIYGKGTESLSIASWNGPGPYKVHNNYLEASTENIMFGGATGTTGHQIPSDVEVTQNYFFKPLTWRNGIIPPPAVSSAFLSGGSLPAGTYYYQVVAHGTAGSDQGVIPIVSGFSELTLTVASNTPVLTWPATGYGDASDARLATNYTIYRTQDPPVIGSPRNFTMFETTALAFSDTGLQVPSATFADPNSYYGPYRQDGDVPLVKNHLEFKCAQRVLVEGNVLENCWANAQGGTSILLTPRSTQLPGMTAAEIAATFPGAISSDISIRNNIVRHVGGGFAVSSRDEFCTSADCATSMRCLVQNNLVYDASEHFSVYGKSFGVLTYVTVDLTLNHNTIQVSGEFSAAQMQVDSPSTRETVTNNIMTGDLANANPQLAGPVGFFQAGNISPVFLNNVLAKVSPYLDIAAWQAAAPSSWILDGISGIGWTNYAQGDFNLTRSSPYENKATDGKDVGVDTTQLNAATSGVVAGTPPHKATH